MTEYEFEVLKKYIDDDDELARIVAEDKEFEEQESKIEGGGEPIEDWLEELAKGDEWSTALVEAINVRAVKDYRHYRWIQRELYATHCENLSVERDAIKKAEKELQKHAREYHKKVVKAEKEFKKADKKYSNACVQVSEVRQYFLGEPWGNIDGKWVMKQIDDQIELDYERMHNHE